MGVELTKNLTRFWYFYNALSSSGAAIRHRGSTIAEFAIIETYLSGGFCSDSWYANGPARLIRRAAAAIPRSTA
jgi:hypothetical protein